MWAAGKTIWNKYHVPVRYEWAIFIHWSSEADPDTQFLNPRIRIHIFKICRIRIRNYLREASKKKKFSGRTTYKQPDLDPDPTL